MEASHRILRFYVKISRQILYLFRERFAQKGLSLSQLLVLTVLNEEGPMTIHALAEYMGSASSTISGIVDRLEKLGLARRSRSGFDRRMTYVEVTEAFVQMWQEAARDLSSWTGRMEELSQKEQEQILRSLDWLESASRPAED